MAPKPNSKKSAAIRVNTREKIKELALDNLIKGGWRGMSFRMIAEKLNVTASSIHYHFRNKDLLVEEVLCEYVADTLAKHKAIWENPNQSITEKLRRVADLNRMRYDKFNRGKRGGQPWSLIGRLRPEADILTPKGRDALNSFYPELHAATKAALRIAEQRGELISEAPFDELAFLMVNIVNSSSVFTQDAGNFEALEGLYSSFSKVLLDAYSPTGLG